jgi:PIN domain nuclease of toxin-antitoxin system
VILLDTHLWIWWVSRDARLSTEHRSVLEQHQASGLGVSAISCWEVAKLVALEVPNWLGRCLQSQSASP